MRSYDAERAKEAHILTEDEVKAFRSDKLVALDRNKAEFCYQLCCVHDNVDAAGGDGVVIGNDTSQVRPAPQERISSRRA